VKGDTQVIALLNDVLSAELTAVNQYWLHARLCENWGYERLWKKVREESLEEMKHADELIERPLPRRDAGSAGSERSTSGRASQTVQARPRRGIPGREADEQGISLCSKGTTTVLAAREMLADEEKHVDWLEEQQRLIDDLGEATYLAEQIKG
jgi:bacterioferritin